MKRVLAIVLIITFAFFLYFFNKMLPDIMTNFGKNAFEKKNYIEAYKDLKFAVTLSPNNRDARYYYVKTMINLKPTLEIQKELYKISEQNQPDSADLVADRQIAKWRNQISFNSGENFIEQAPYDNKILRWDITKFPLKVHIENSAPSTVPAYYKTEITKAFMQWQGSTANFINFSFVENPKEANIFVKIVPLNERSNCEKGECKYVVAYTMPTVNNNLLEKMEIIFFDTNNLKQPFSQREVYNTALHEIGHALGIMGHSYNKDTLMYMETNQKDMFASMRSDFQLISPKDLNTLNLLYKLIPDITNTPLREYDTKRQFYAPIVLGTSKQINSRKTIEAQNYINNAPDLPNGYIDLASALSEQKEYNGAIEALNKALELSSNSNEKFVIYYNSALIYMKINDWDNALKYAELAKQLQPAAEIDGLIGAIIFNKGDINLAKQTYTEFLEKNPSNTVDAINLTRIYLKEFNLPQAGKTLNKLVKANPDAKSDPRIKAMGLIMFLFR